MKICSRCELSLSFDNFHKNKRMKDGHNSWCKSCMKDWTKENSESRKEYYHKYHLENAEHKKQVASDWYYSNYEQARQKRKIRYEENKEVILEQIKQYRQTPNGRAVHRKSNNKRKRSLKWIELFLNPFPKEVKVDYHHINDLLVIPLPHKIHNGNSGVDTEVHREKCKYWISYLYGLDTNKLLNL